MAESVDSSNAAAPVDEIGRETATSLKGSYRQTSPARERIICGARDHQDARAVRRAKRVLGSPGSAVGFGCGRMRPAGLILHALGPLRPHGFVRGAGEGVVMRMRLQGGQSRQSQLRVTDQRQRTARKRALPHRGTHETLRRKVERLNR